MRAGRLATVATLVLVGYLSAPPAKAQVIFSTGVGVCKECGHSELDTQRYVNSFLNQLFFPQSVVNRTAVAASLYLLTATYTIHGRLSPDPQFSSVTITITAEIKKALPTGSYHVTVVTPGGKSLAAVYPIGSEPFSVDGRYAPGAKRRGKRKTRAVGSGGSGPGSHGGYPSPNSTHSGRDGSRSSNGCRRSRLEARGSETILYCSAT